MVSVKLTDTQIADLAMIMRNFDGDLDLPEVVVEDLKAGLPDIFFALRDALLRDMPEVLN